MQRVLCILGLVVGLSLSAVVAPAQAHLAYFTGDESVSCFIAVGSDCFFRPGDTIVHSYGFVSGRNDSGGSAAWLCPSIWDANGRKSECGYNFERYCYDPWNHSSDDLDCHDEDNVSHYASVWNGGPTSAGGKTVGIHVLY